MSSYQDILSLESKQSSSIQLKQYFREGPVNEFLPLALAHKTLQLELLKNTLGELTLFFLNDKENLTDKGLLAKKTTCFCSDRHAVKQLFLERNELLIQFFYSLFGERGSMDIFPLTNTIAHFAHLDLDELKKDSLQLFAITAASAGAMFFAPSLLTSLGLSLGQLAKMSLILRAGGFGWLTYTAYQQLPDYWESIRPTPEYGLTKGIVSEVLSQANVAINLSEDPLSLVQISKNYELNYHIHKMKTNPRKKMEPLLNNQIKKYGSLENVLSNWGLRIEKIKQQIKINKDEESKRKNCPN